MADMSDVANALVQISAAAAYPEGTSQPSIGNCDIIVYQGWPNPQDLDTDLAAGKVHISVYPQAADTVTSVMMGDTSWIELDNDGAKGHSAREIRRQTKQFQITIWAPTPALRDTIGAILDVALALTSRIAMPDQTQGLLSYGKQRNSDEQQKVLIYRRDFFYAANYATLQSDAEFTIKQTVTDIEFSLDGLETTRTTSTTSPS